jgi:hypothetical protein
VIDPSSPNTLYAGTHIGVFKSTDGGGSWGNASLGPPITGIDLSINNLEQSITALVIDPSRPNTLYAGADDFTLLYKSSDGGISWNRANNTFLPTHGMTLPTINFLAIDPFQPATLYTVASGELLKFTSVSECLFNWAEKNYPTLFNPPKLPTAVWSNYIYRYYSETNTYLGISSIDNRVYYQGPDGNLLEKGALMDWLPKASCPVPALPPIECLFNWEEHMFPDMFSSPELPTITSGIYTYRHYTETNTYLGLSSADNHIWFMWSGDGIFQDYGPFSNLLHISSCQ